MHERYTDKEMSQIWSEKNKFEKWFDIELHVAKIQSELGIIPYDVPKTMETLKTACFSYGYVQKINEIEKTTKHDIIAFLTHLSNVIGEPSKYIHYGMIKRFAASGWIHFLRISRTTAYHIMGMMTCVNYYIFDCF